MDNYLENLPKPFFILAPMYDVTDTVFRRIITETARPDVFFTEFVNVDGLQSSGRSKIIHRLMFSSEEQPIVAQIWGKNPENYRKTASELTAMGFAGVDINMGCPDKAVLKNGCCGALINNHDLAHEIIKASREGIAGKIPLSVKTRIGFREFDETWIRFLLGQKLNMLSIHLRTVREMSKVPAHFEFIDKIKTLRDEISPETILTINGDIETRYHGQELYEKYQIDGVMIGRGVFKDPYVFSESSEWGHSSKDKKIELYKKHVKLFDKTWKHKEYPLVALNKFCKIYINGFDGAKELREELMKSDSIDQLLSKLRTQKYN